MAHQPIAPVTESEKRTPCIYIDLTKADLGELKGLTVGERAKVSIVGKIVELRMRDDDSERTGTIAIESNDVTVRDAPSKMTDLMDEDDDY